MLIELSISATHATSQGAPIKKEFTVPVGTIAKVRARMPALAVPAEVGFQLQHAGSSFAPAPSDDLWAAHDQGAPATIEWEEEKAITGRGGALEIAAYNTHATIDYIIRIDLVLVPEFYPRKIVERLNALALSIGDFLATVKEHEPGQGPGPVRGPVLGASERPK